MILAVCSSKLFVFHSMPKEGVVKNVRIAIQHSGHYIEKDHRIGRQAGLSPDTGLDFSSKSAVYSEFGKVFSNSFVSAVTPDSQRRGYLHHITCGQLAPSDRPSLGYQPETRLSKPSRHLEPAFSSLDIFSELALTSIAAKSFWSTCIYQLFLCQLRPFVP